MVPLICASHTYTSAKYDVSPIQFSCMFQANILNIKLRLWFINIAVAPRISGLLNNI